MDRKLMQLRREWESTGCENIGDQYVLALVRAGLPFRPEGLTPSKDVESVLEDIVGDFLASTQRLNYLKEKVMETLIEDCDFQEHRISYSPKQFNAVRAFGTARIFVRIWLPSKEAILITGKMHDARLIVAGSARERPDTISALMERLPSFPVCSDLVANEVLTKRDWRKSGRQPLYSTFVRRRYPNNLTVAERELLIAPPTFEELEQRPGDSVVPWIG